MKDFFQILVYILLAFIVSSCNDNIELIKDIENTSIDKLIETNRIGLIQDDVYVHKNKDFIINFMNESIIENGYSDHIEEIVLQKGELNKDGSENFMLVGVSSDKTIKVGIPIINIDNSRLTMRLGTTVTCKGCRQGCNPRGEEGNFYCTSCVTEGECEKTEVKKPIELTPAGT